MTLEMQSVFSSNVDEIGYDPETSDLVVVWRSGKRSIYSGVPQDVANDVMNAASVGQALNMSVKPLYAHRYG
jgi:hypothetical protein